MRVFPLALVPIALVWASACGPDTASRSPAATASTRQPSASPRPSWPSAQASRSPVPARLPAPRPTSWPLRCDRVPLASRLAASGDVTGDGVPDTVRLAWCDAGAGSPPQRLGVVDGRTSRLVAVLPSRGFELYDSVMVAGGEVRATGLGFSAASVPRCCPDRRVPLAWRLGPAG